MRLVVGTVLTVGDPEPPLGTAVVDLAGCTWVHTHGDMGPPFGESIDTWELFIQEHGPVAVRWLPGLLTTT